MGLHKLGLVSARCMAFMFSSSLASVQLDHELILKSTFIYNTPSLGRLFSGDVPHCGGTDKGRVMGITQALAAPYGAVFLSAPSDLYPAQLFGQWSLALESPA